MATAAPTAQSFHARASTTTPATVLTEATSPAPPRAPVASNSSGEKVAIFVLPVNQGFSTAYGTDAGGSNASISAILILFNSFVMPEMNFKARMLSGDIYRKRPDLNIEPGYFMDDLPSYSMIIRDKDGDTLKDVRIFSKGSSQTQTSIHSETGTLSTIDDAIVLDMFDGEIHELGQKDYTNYRRIIFDKHVINIPAKDLLLNRRDSTNRSDREMTVPMIQKKISSYEKRLKIVHKRLSGNFFRTIGDSLLPATLIEGKKIIDDAIQRVKNQDSLSVMQKIKKEKRIKNLERQLNNEFNLIKSYKKSQNKYGVEIHKKFSIPVACILFVLLGAPLGVMSKKGGFAISTGLSFGFFLIYYVLLISGEEMADRTFLSPAVGMWSPNLIILLIAVYLLINTVRENAAIGIKLPHIFKKPKK